MNPIHGEAEKAIGKTIETMEYEHPDADSFRMRIHFTDGSALGVGFNAHTTMEDDSGKKTPVSASGWSFSEAKEHL